MLMHLQQETVSRQDGWVDEALSGADPTRSGVIVARGLGHTPQGLSTTVLTFVASSGDDQDFVVDHSHEGTDPGPARVAQITRFTGPRSAEWVAAETRASTERVWPAVQGLPGFVAAFHGRAADGDTVSVVLATSVEALLEGQRRIMATELLPGEDPALLTGPDRVEVLQLEHVELPSALMSSEASR